MNTTANPFWKNHPGLVWSNPVADDSAHIRAALMKPRFSQLLQLSVEFGVDRLHSEWNELNSDDTAEVRRVRASVERILANIEKGFALAAARN